MEGAEGVGGYPFPGQEAANGDPQLEQGHGGPEGHSADAILGQRPGSAGGHGAGAVLGRDLAGGDGGAPIEAAGLRFPPMTDGGIAYSRWLDSCNPVAAGVMDRAEAEQPQAGATLRLDGGTQITVFGRRGGADLGHVFDLGRQDVKDRSWFVCRDGIGTTQHPALPQRPNMGGQVTKRTLHDGRTIARKDATYVVRAKADGADKPKDIVVTLYGKAWKIFQFKLPGRQYWVGHVKSYEPAAGTATHAVQELVDGGGGGGAAGTGAGGGVHDEQAGGSGEMDGGDCEDQGLIEGGGWGGLGGGALDDGDQSGEFVFQSGHLHKQDTEGCKGSLERLDLNAASGAEGSGVDGGGEADAETGQSAAGGSAAGDALDSLGKRGRGTADDEDDGFGQAVNECMRVLSAAIEEHGGLPEGEIPALQAMLRASLDQIRVRVKEAASKNKRPSTRDCRWPDYVFEPEHVLTSVREVWEHMWKHKRLPYMRSAKDVEESGIDVRVPDAQRADIKQELPGILRNLEELTIHFCEMWLRMEETRTPALNEPAQRVQHAQERSECLQRFLAGMGGFDAGVLRRLRGYCTAVDRHVIKAVKVSAKAQVQERDDPEAWALMDMVGEKRRTECMVQYRKYLNALGCKLTLELANEVGVGSQNGTNVRPPRAGEFMRRCGLLIDEEARERVEEFNRVEQQSYTDWTPFPHQEELVGMIGGRDALIVARTGCGKMRMAALEIDKVLESGRRAGTSACKVVVVCQEIALTLQQAAELKRTCRPFIRKEDGLQGPIVTAFGSFNPVCKKESWDELLEKYDVMVFTPKTLLNCLDDRKMRKGHAMPGVGLLVIDEVHHTSKEHPFSVLVKEYVPPVSGYTRMLGLTAAVGGSIVAGVSLGRVVNLSEMLNNAKVISENDLSEAARVVLEERCPRVPETAVEVSEVPEEVWFAERATELRDRVGTHAGKFKEESSERRLLKELERGVFDEALRVAEDCGVREGLCCVAEGFVTLLLAPGTDPLLCEWMGHVMGTCRLFDDTSEALGAGLRCDEAGCVVGGAVEKHRCLVKELEALMREQEREGGLGDFKCIVFVQTRRGVRALLRLLQRGGGGGDVEGLDYVSENARVGKLVGKGSKAVSETHYSQFQTLRRFRRVPAGEVEGSSDHLNLLVATSVCEEGIDVPALNLVVRSDGVSSDVSLEQSRGRVRRAEGCVRKFVVMWRGERQQVMYNNARESAKNAQAALREFKLLPPSG